MNSKRMIEYSEIKFFKKVRKRLSIQDGIILTNYPDKTDILLPDTETTDDMMRNNDIKYNHIFLQ